MVTAEGFTKLFNSLVFKGTNFTCDVVPIPNQKSVLVINYKLSNHFECLGELILKIMVGYMRLIYYLRWVVPFHI